jgi:hypothetical protein
METSDQSHPSRADTPEQLGEKIAIAQKEVEDINALRAFKPFTGFYLKRLKKRTEKIERKMKRQEDLTLDQREALRLIVLELEFIIADFLDQEERASRATIELHVAAGGEAQPSSMRPTQI